MILYYAMGGGLGHLARARAVLHTLGLESEACILTASPFASDQRITGGIRIITVPAALDDDRAAYKLWLDALIAEHQPEAIYLDTFPAGIRGELCDAPPFATIPFYYVARLLRWSEYARLLPSLPPRFVSTHVLEPLDPEHEQFIKRYSATYSPLALRDPPQVLSESERELVEQLLTDGRPLWLLVHSGSDEEVAEIVSYADEMRRIEGIQARLVLVARAVPSELPADVLCLDVYPAALLFPMAARVVSACGFNVMRQMNAYRQKHRYLPFARRFDDQFKRAARLA
jgi:hypothetical protein